MSLKQVGLGVISIAIAAVLYYVSVGSSKLTQELKAEVDKELHTLRSQGFGIEERKVSKNKEHFEIVFNDTAKIANYLNTQGASLTDEESASFKGMKIGVDLTYLKDNYSSISFDLYPTALPITLTQGKLSTEDKETLARINTLFDKKAFLMHIDINIMLNAFKGYIKDIDETFSEPGGKVIMQMKAMHFNGEMDTEKVISVDQTLESFLINAEDELLIQLLGLKSHYQLTGPSRYDITGRYSMEKISFEDASNESITINNLEVNTTTILQNDLAKSEVSSTIETITVTEEKKTSKITDLVLDMKVSNLDIKSFEALQQVDPAEQQQIDKLVQEIISKGLSIEILKLSVNKLYTQHKEMDGFSLKAKVDIDKNLKLADLQANPMLGLTAVQADLNLTFSETLHTFIAQQPEALITMMMFQPKEKNGNKTYQIKLENGMLSINGVLMQ
ncbi:hypothetical protein PGH07_05000 [Sulfurovum sp. zt1-1]|uniref:DUF945 domain-containing protein n=1 Tax=Sulfurovum zhangzhouensis TaxID=3019067 RepID=A0ABT7QXG6_9BACT|nr:hypothetical protein [Sulfurovum zhangzhouensis]MDM5271523.1 hypothetical protein [Sulfurovum zhangzhouensis]